MFAAWPLVQLAVSMVPEASAWWFPWVTCESGMKESGLDSPCWPQLSLLQSGLFFRHTQFGQSPKHYLYDRPGLRGVQGQVRKTALREFLQPVHTIPLSLVKGASGHEEIN